MVPYSRLLPLTLSFFVLFLIAQEAQRYLFSVSDGPMVSRTGSRSSNGILPPFHLGHAVSITFFKKVLSFSSPGPDPADTNTSTQDIISRTPDA